MIAEHMAGRKTLSTEIRSVLMGVESVNLELESYSSMLYWNSWGKQGHQW